MNEYIIAPSLHDSGCYFLFCPTGEEKKFLISPKGQIVDFEVGKEITPSQSIIIKQIFKSKGWL